MVPRCRRPVGWPVSGSRSEEHTSELSHSQISYAVFCLKKKKERNDIILEMIKTQTRPQTPRCTAYSLLIAPDLTRAIVCHNEHHPLAYLCGPPPVNDSSA